MINIREASLTLSMGGTHTLTNTAFWFADFPPNLDMEFRMDFFSTPSYLFKESIRYPTRSSLGSLGLPGYFTIRCRKLWLSLFIV
jgi:hypothetical protein